MVLCVVGYFAYQYFVAPWLAGKKSTTSGYSLYLPEECQSEGESLRMAFTRQEEQGNLSEVGQNGFIRNYKNCLKFKTDFADSQIDEAVEIIKNSR